jgi:Ca2+-binding RTX toxin-like protein
VPRFILSLLGCALVAAPAAFAQLPVGVCQDAPAGVECQLGGGRTSEGGAAAGKVSHKGWPAVTGVLWVLDHNGRGGTGTVLNDELLGGHGNDRLDGADGADILWGDMWPTGNTTRQRDVLTGGQGNDWIYASHGTNTVSGGRGNDRIWAYFAVHAIIHAGAGNDHVWARHGRGLVDCGAGDDVIRIPLSGYRVRHCETVKHWCAFGDDGHGGCRQGGRAVLAAKP